MKLKQVKKKEKIQRDNIDDKMMTKQEEKKNLFYDTRKIFHKNNNILLSRKYTIKICSVFTSNEN
jgi:hypothetical protein